MQVSIISFSTPSRFTRKKKKKQKIFHVLQSLYRMKISILRQPPDKWNMSKINKSLSSRAKSRRYIKTRSNNIENRIEEEKLFHVTEPIVEAEEEEKLFHFLRERRKAFFPTRDFTSLCVEIARRIFFLQFSWCSVCDQERSPCRVCLFQIAIEIKFALCGPSVFSEEVYLLFPNYLRVTFLEFSLPNSIWQRMEKNTFQSRQSRKEFSEINPAKIFIIFIYGFFSFLMLFLSFILHPADGNTQRDGEKKLL